MTTLHKDIVKWDFETIYIQLRQRERRIYTDEEVAQHPSISCNDDLGNYNHSILYDPKRMFNKFLRNKNPFPWISIQSSNS